MKMNGRSIGLEVLRASWRDIQSVQLSDNYFKMQYMHMKDGLNDGKYFEKIYDDNSKYFNIVMTNPAFSYDPATNIIRVSANFIHNS